MGAILPPIRLYSLNLVEAVSANFALRRFLRRSCPQRVPAYEQRPGLPEREDNESKRVPRTHRYRSKGGGDEEVGQPVARVCLRGGPSPHRAEPTVDCKVDRDGQREEQRRYL